MPTAAEIHNRGNHFYASGRYAEALVFYNEALRLDLSFKEAHCSKGNALLGLGRYAEALASYNEALGLDLSFKEAHFGKGHVLRSLGHYDEALASYNEALRLDPSFKEAHHAKGALLRDLGRYDEALASHEEALRLDSSFEEAHFGKGNALYGLGRYAEAIASFNKALRLNPCFKEAHGSKGYVLYGLGRYAEALASYNKALCLDPGYALALKKKEELEALLADGAAAAGGGAAGGAGAVAPSYPPFSIIPYEHLTFGKELGRGRSGIVTSADWVGRSVAVKQPRAPLSKGSRARFQREVLGHAELEAELEGEDKGCIVGVVGVCLEGDTYCMVMELMPQGSLYDVLRNGKPLPLDVRHRIACDIAAALRSLHRHGITHCDVKSPNVLVGDHMRAKLADLELMRVKGESSSSASAAGSPFWMAPELLSNDGGCTSASDVYSVGVIFWELLSGKLPFEDLLLKGLQPDGFKAKIIAGERDEIPESPLPTVGKLVALCWAQGAPDRPTAEAVLDQLKTTPESELTAAAAYRRF